AHDQEVRNAAQAAESDRGHVILPELDSALALSTSESGLGGAGSGHRRSPEIRTADSPAALTFLTNTVRLADLSAARTSSKAGPSLPRRRLTDRPDILAALGNTDRKETDDMSFQGWPEAALDFFEGLEQDNSKAYWTAHKAIYSEAVLGPMAELTEDLSPEFGTVKIFRPYRDIRFSADKSPYRADMIATGGTP